MFIENISDNASEREVIFPSGSEFIIDDVLPNKTFMFQGREYNLTVIQITIPLYISNLLAWINKSEV